jgi:hypothetical protein
MARVSGKDILVYRITHRVTIRSNRFSRQYFLQKSTRDKRVSPQEKCFLRINALSTTEKQ